MDLITLVLVWCGIYLSSVSICLTGANPLSELCVDFNGTHICYWVILTKQDATSGEAICKLRVDNATLAYIPNEHALLEVSAFLIGQLGTGTFVFIGYTRTIQAYLKIRGTDREQTWVAWDTAFAQPNNGGQCVAIFTATGKFHDILCTEDFYALCSVLNSTETPTTDTTNHPTTEITTDVTPTVTIDNNDDVNDTNSTACHCDCSARRHIVINPVINITKELRDRLDTLKKETKVNEEMLSSTIRTKTCASDPRPSSAYVGYLGVTLLTVIFGGILMVDLPKVIMTLKMFYYRFC